MEEHNTIFIIEDEPTISALIKDVIESAGLNNYFVRIFSSISDAVLNPLFENVDVFIVDIVLKKENGLMMCNSVDPDSPVTFLFISGNVSEEDFHKNLPENCICDFLEKPFSNEMLLNKLKILLRISKRNKAYQIEKEKVEKLLWSVINYSKFYFLVIDSSINIRIANLSLANILGFESPEELTGRDFKEFLSDSSKEAISALFKESEDKTKKVQSTGECIYDVYSYIEKKRTTVRWFSTRLNGFILTFGVSILYEIVEDNIKDENSVRHLWETEIKKDKVFIESIKIAARKQLGEIRKSSEETYKTCFANSYNLRQ